MFCRTLTAEDLRRADFSVKSNKVIPEDVKEKFKLDPSAHALTYKHLALVTKSATQVLPLRIINLNSKAALQLLGLRNYDPYLANPFFSKSSHTFISMAQSRMYCVVLLKFVGQSAEMFASSGDGDTLLIILLRMDKIRNSQHDLYVAGAERITLLPTNMFPDKKVTRCNTAINIYNDSVFIFNIDTKPGLSAGEMRGKCVHATIKNFMEADQMMKAASLVPWKICGLGIGLHKPFKQVWLYNDKVKRGMCEGYPSMMLSPCCDKEECDGKHNAHC